MATNDYIQNLAQLIDQDLNPYLKVYVEYSNETWDSIFTQYNEVLAAADSNPLVTYRNSNDGLAVAQQTAFKTNAIGDIFKQVFGSQASRVLPVLGGWAAVPSYNQPFQHATSCIIMGEGNGLRLSTSPRQGCVNHYVLARMPAPTPMLTPRLAAPRVSTDSRHCSLSDASN